MLYDINGEFNAAHTCGSIPAVKMEGVSKVYKLYHRRQDRFLEAIDVFNRNKTKYARRFYALKDVNIEIPQGETIGIIGRNGSGKSTLLGIIAGVIQPSFGKVTTQGRIAFLLELGAGFNPDLTGIENIYFHGTTTGLSRSDIDKKMNEIITFADIGEYIDQPVKTYSSGMFVRLAFAVSISIRPDILIIDEALSVGDIQFQAKCMTAIDLIRKSGATILLVTHDLRAIKSFCQRAIYLEKGCIKSIGKAADIAEQYDRDMKNEASVQIRAFMKDSEGEFHLSDTASTTLPESINEHFKFKTSQTFDNMVASHRFGMGGMRIRFVEMTDEQGTPLTDVPFNGLVNIRIHLESYCKGTVGLSVLVKNAHKIAVLEFSFKQTGQDDMKLVPGDRRILTYKTHLPLGDGLHSLEVILINPLSKTNQTEVMDGIKDAFTFRMTTAPGQRRIWTITDVPHTLHIQTPADKFTSVEASGFKIEKTAEQ